MIGLFAAFYAAKVGLSDEKCDKSFLNKDLLRISVRIHQQALMFAGWESLGGHWNLMPA